MNEPRWVPRRVVEATHWDQLREHGGLPGIRDENALESALARARQKFAYDDSVDLADLGAAYAFGMARSHAFNDGNKRTAFLTAAIFLGYNGFEIDASEAEVVITMIALAAGELSERDMAAWLRPRLIRYAPD
jgi:death-on-curing protein